MSSLAERLVRRSRRDASTGCLVWQGSTRSNGYGQIKGYDKIVSVHRAAYAEWIGPIPEGLDVDHLCGVRACIEPSHLEAVSHHENLLRSKGHPGRNARKTECPHGHPLPPFAPGGHRRCETCRRARGNCPICDKDLSVAEIKPHIARKHGGRV